MVHIAHLSNSYSQGNAEMLKITPSSDNWFKTCAQLKKNNFSCFVTSAAFKIVAGSRL